MGEPERKCFIVSVIGAPGSRERKHADLVLNYIIRPIATDAGYHVTRGDHGSHSGMITVDVINNILDSDLVIADLSFLNPNVFYEMGLRHSTRKPTIHMASADTVVPFDNADHRAIFFDLGDFDSHVKTRDALRRHIAAIENDVVTNPVTIAQAHKNDAHLTRVIAAVKVQLRTLEARIERIAEPPPPGRITRDQYEELTHGHRNAIIQIARAIRERIDGHNMDPDSAEVIDIAEVTQRLSRIERILANTESIYAAAPTTTQ